MSALVEARWHLAKYQSVDVGRSDAAKAVEWAQKLLDGAIEIVTE